jgi:magnesium transporter
MFHAYLLASRDAEMAYGQGMSTVEAATASDDSVVWIDVDEPCKETMRQLREAFGLHPEAVEDCLRGTPRPRYMEYGETRFLLVYGALARLNPPEFESVKLSIYFGKGFLITVHEAPVSGVSRLRERVEKNRHLTLRRGVEHLLFLLLDFLAENYLLSSEYYEDKLEDLEQISVSPDADASLLVELGVVRRVLAEMRRSIAAHHEALNELSQEDGDLVSAEFEKRMQHVLSHFKQAEDQVEGLRELAHFVQSNYFGTLSERTNQFMRTLTMFSAFIMPLTLITGFYGMNLPLWPSQDAFLTTVLVSAGMLSVMACMWYYFKKRGWL